VIPRRDLVRSRGGWGLGNPLAHVGRERPPFDFWKTMVSSAAVAWRATFAAADLS
jgi:hypothetical protein